MRSPRKRSPRNMMRSPRKRSLKNLMNLMRSQRNLLKSIRTGYDKDDEDEDG
jgi:hypothetical protein